MITDRSYRNATVSRKRLQELSERAGQGKKLQRIDRMLVFTRPFRVKYGRCFCHRMGCGGNMPWNRAKTISLVPRPEFHARVLCRPRGRIGVC